MKRLIGKISVTKLVGSVKIVPSGNLLQNKEVIPTTAEQIVRPDPNYDGLASVKVSGDEHLLPENIKYGVSIFDVMGTHQGGNAKTHAITVTPTGKDFTEYPYSGYDGIDEVNVKGDFNLEPWNIREGITIYGVTGTMRTHITDEVQDDFESENPENPDPGTIEDAESQYEIETGKPFAGDMFLLVDDEGNRTYGFMEHGGEYDFTSQFVVGGIAPEKYSDKFVSDTVTNRARIGGAESNTISFSPGTTITALIDASVSMYWAVFCVTSTGATKVSKKSGALISGTDVIDSFWLRSGDAYTIPEDTQFCWFNLRREDGKDISLSDMKQFLIAKNCFEITSYNQETTEFKAKNWRRLSYHTTGEFAGTWTNDTFIDTESNGWNYLKHLVMCTRSTLTYNRLVIWPSRLQFLFNPVNQMGRGALTRFTSGNYANNNTNRLRLGYPEGNITIQSGKTVTVLTKGIPQAQWAMWFILSSGAAKILARQDMTVNTDYIDTGWQSDGIHFVVPEDTQYIWLNFREYTNKDITLAELEEYNIYEVKK